MIPTFEDFFANFHNKFFRLIYLTVNYLFTRKLLYFFQATQFIDHTKQKSRRLQRTTKFVLILNVLKVLLKLKSKFSFFVLAKKRVTSNELCSLFTFGLAFLESAVLIHWKFTSSNEKTCAPCSPFVFYRENMNWKLKARLTHSMTSQASDTDIDRQK